MKKPGRGCPPRASPPSLSSFATLFASHFTRGPMNHFVRKPVFISSVVAVSLAAAVLTARAQNSPQAQPAQAAPKTASQQFKNVQVLKDIPADQLIPAMQFITASLGVECEYCHVEHAMDKDDKKTKVTARKMMEMMITINAENFDGHREVTCYTCHQGAAKPVGIPIISEHGRMPEVKEGDTINGMSAELLLDKYLAATGGAEALKKISSRVINGNVRVGDQLMSVEIFAKSPDKRVSVVKMKDGDSVTAYTGKVGWLAIPGRVHMLNAQESFGAKMDADFAFAVDVKSLYPKWETLPGEKIDGKETWLVVSKKEGEPPLKLYFDQQSNLLVRLIRYIDSPLGYNPTQIDYADYRAIDGVKTPYRWTVARPGNRFTVQVEELRQNVPVDDAKFIPPPPPPSPLPPPSH